MDALRDVDGRAARLRGGMLDVTTGRRVPRVARRMGLGVPPLA